MLDAKTAIAAIAAIWAFVSTVVAWSFATGKFAGGQAALEERLRREIGEAERRAKQEALANLTPDIMRLWEKKVSTELHDEQIDELKRRVAYCERKLHMGNGAGV